MEKLVCDKCGTEYTDKKSIDAMKEAQEFWKALCVSGDIEHRGIGPCSGITCTGQLVLTQNTEKAVLTLEPGWETVLEIRCMFCDKHMGKKDGGGVEGVTGSICQDCWEEHFPGQPYPEEPNG